MVLNDGGAKLDFDFIVINQAGTGEYQNAITKCFGEIGEYIFNDIAEDDGTPIQTAVDSICNDPPLYLKPFKKWPELETDEFLRQRRCPAKRRGQQRPASSVGSMCEIREWSLELDAPSVGHHWRRGEVWGGL